MWTSVPQIDATFTRIRTSVGPTDGIGTVRTSVLFGAAFDFTAAFIVDVIPKSPGRVRSWTLGISTFYHSPGSLTESESLEAVPQVTAESDATSTCGSQRSRKGTRATDTPRRGWDLPCRREGPASRRACWVSRRRSRSAFRFAGGRPDSPGGSRVRG